MSTKSANTPDKETAIKVTDNKTENASSQGNHQYQKPEVGFYIESDTSSVKNSNGNTSSEKTVNKNSVNSFPHKIYRNTRNSWRIFSTQSLQNVVNYLAVLWRFSNINNH